MNGQAHGYDQQAEMVKPSRNSPRKVRLKSRQRWHTQNYHHMCKITSGCRNTLLQHREIVLDRYHRSTTYLGVIKL